MVETMSMSSAASEPGRESENSYDPRLSGQQTSPLEVAGASVALSAGAGCGKTTVLTARYLRDLEGPPARPLSAIVALTFTEKAARELRQRIRRECREKLAAGADPGRWRAVLRGLEAAPIGTFHEYCGQWLRRHAVEAGIDPDFVILDAAVAGAIRDEALAKCLRRWLAIQEPDLIELAAEYGLGRIRQGLADFLSDASPDQLERWQMSSPTELVTVWEHVWRESGGPLLRQRLTRAAESALDLLSRHESSHRLMRERALFLVESLPRLEVQCDNDGWLQSVRDHALIQGAGGKNHWPSLEVYEAVRDGLKAVRDAIDQYRDKVKWDRKTTLEAAEQGLRLARLAARARLAYDAAKRERGGLDFDDLLNLTLGLLRRSAELPQTGAGQNDSIERLLVDEFQDTDPTQSEILERFAAEEASRGRLFLVGDYKQSIYRFRGAQPELFQKFRERFPETGRHALTENFRSVPEILDFVNALFASTFPGADTPLSARVSNLAPTEQPAVEFLWASESDSNEGTGSKPSAHDRRRLEARWLARRLRQRFEHGWKVRDRKTKLIRDAHPGDVAFLFRAMTDVGPYESALDEEGFDYHTVGGAAFYVQQEVTDVINVLSVLEDPFDPVALAGALRSPFFCLSDDALFWLTTARASLVDGLEHAHAIDELNDLDRQHACRARDLLTRWRRFKDKEPIASLLDRILDESGYEAGLLGESLGARKRANARKLVRMAREFDQQKGLSLASFVAKLRADLKRPPREEQAATTDEEGTSVRLMSIHQAKGLEFPIVVLPDLNRRPVQQLDPTAFHSTLGPLLRPSRDAGMASPSPSPSPLSAESAGDSSSLQSLGWLTYLTLEQREDEEESLRLFYVATTRARDSLILSAALSPSDKASSPAMALLDERFERESGICRVQLPDGWAVPSIQVITESPPTSGGTQHRRAWRLPLIETAELIEQSKLVDEGPAVGDMPRPRYLALNSLPRLGSVTVSGTGSEVETSAERLDRLTRIVLADPSTYRAKELSRHVVRVVNRHDPLLSSRRRDALNARLAGWSRMPVRQALRSSQLVERDLEWTVAWPPESHDPTVYHGTIDLLFRDSSGYAQILNVRTAGNSADRQRFELELLLSLHLAESWGLGPIRQGWWLGSGCVPGSDGEWHREAAFDPATIDQAIRAWLTVRGGG